MKRKSLLFLLLMAMFAPLAMQAQSTLTVCEGTATNNYVPFYGYYADETQRNQMIYPAMRAMNGGYINEMVFDCAQIGSAYNGGLGDWIVSLGETNATTLTALDNTTTLTQVYSGELTVNAAENKVIVTFTTPYLYNGENLLVEFNHPVPAGYRQIYFYGIEASNAAYTYNASRSFLPQTTFIYYSADYCFTPTGVTAVPGPTSATLDWNSEANAWNIRYRINSNSQAQVILSTDFENGLPSGWATIDNDADGNNWEWSNEMEANSGTGMMYSASYLNDKKASASYKELKNTKGALFPDNLLVTPQVSLGGSISLYARGQDASWCGEHFAVFVSTTSQTDVRTFTQVSQEFIATGAYKEYVVDLSAYNGQNGYIAIRHFNITDMFYLDVDDVTVYGPVAQNAWTTINNVTTKPYTIEGLASETMYDVEVQAVCSSSSSSDWSETSQFTTTSTCSAPVNLTVNDITHYGATLSWTGYQNSYTVQYREAAHSDVIFFDDFEDGILNNWGWTTYTEGDDFSGFGWFDYNPTSLSSNFPAAYSGTNCAVSLSYTNTSLDADNYLVSPQVELGGTLKFWVISNYADQYEVLLSTNGNSIRDFNVTLQGLEEAPYSWTEISIDLSSYAGQQGYIAIHHQQYDGWLIAIDDFGIYGEEIPAGRWQTATANEPTLTLEGLNIGTEYEWQVQGNCTSGETEMTAGPNFTTLDASLNIFVTDGEWNTRSNWVLNTVPAATDDVVIRANAIVPAGYDAQANEITLDGGTITVKDGGQIHSNTDVTATIEKDITGYTSTKDNYYLIASPLWAATTSPSNVQNLLTGNYDFYAFNGYEDLEWRNYRANSFTTMDQGIGYLYANSATTTLSYTGTIRAQLSSFIYNAVILNYDERAEFGAWNLAGNLLPHDGYPYVGTVEDGYVVYADEQNFYTMGDGDIIVAENDFVRPAEGIFVEASGEEQYVFWSSESHSTKSGKVNMTVTNAGGLIDRAVLRFGQGQGLKKFQINKDHTKLFMPVEGNDYAVVYTENEGEMPVSFKAEYNGTYTLSFNTENVELGYLHLIDNMTGNDVDLLNNPSYTFEAKSTDYANRFKLVFATGNADDNFAFFSNGSFVINNEGNATVQVIDVNGRILSSENINGCANLNVNAAPGVYMLRLVNGENVKIQKVVVR